MFMKTVYLKTRAQVHEYEKRMFEMNAAVGLKKFIENPE
jgi:hypothetical protein